MSSSSTPRRTEEIRADGRVDRVMTLLPRERRAAVDARDWLAHFLDGRVTPSLAADAALVVS